MDNLLFFKLKFVCPYMPPFFFLIIHIQYIIMAFNVLLQTRDAIEVEATSHELNIIYSVSFPTDQIPQLFVQKLQVGDCNEDLYTI